MSMHSNDHDALLNELYQGIGQTISTLHAHELRLSEGELEDSRLKPKQRESESASSQRSQEILDRILSLLEAKPLTLRLLELDIQVLLETGLYLLLGEDVLWLLWSMEKVRIIARDIRGMPEAMREEVLETAVAIRQIEQMKANMPDDSPELRRFKNSDPYRFINISERGKFYVESLVSFSESDFQAVIQECLEDAL